MERYKELLKGLGGGRHAYIITSLLITLSETSLGGVGGGNVFISSDLLYFWV